MEFASVIGPQASAFFSMRTNQRVSDYCYVISRDPRQSFRALVSIGGGLRPFCLHHAVYGALAVLIAISLSGCASAPRFSKNGAAPVSGVLQDSVLHTDVPKVGDIVNEVQTEIHDALMKIMHDKTPSTQAIRNSFNTYGLAATISLTLEVTSNDGINPSLTYIDPLHPRAPAAGMATPAEQQKFTAAASGQLSQTSHRNIILTFDLLFDPRITKELGNSIPEQHTIFKEGLDLEPVVSTGLLFSPTTPGDWPSPLQQSWLSVSAPTPQPVPPPPPPPGSPSLTGQQNSNARPTFSSEEDFTVVVALGVTPTWSLVHFMGPGSGGGGGGGGAGGGGSSGGGSSSSSGSGGGQGGPGNGFLNYGHTVKDTIQISFDRYQYTPEKTIQAHIDQRFVRATSEKSLELMSSSEKSLLRTNIENDVRALDQQENLKNNQVEIQAAIQQTRDALLEMRLQQLAR
jgi:hypothetical protein